MSDEYQEWEELRRQASEAEQHATRHSLWHKFWSWALREIESAQKDIIDERFKR